ncbi:putative alanyl-tRNA synthetase [Actinoplanes missouriensis 431]|uniref:Alanine--tRNA ligase n=1 Tax=Actinoplanes missouriensis (strain ATCC 14538 / DSM 43046 / CBS 188.64 / JCM 3121 / NBRC 102363 / NCIMB 12654 / NRRL B-3342 / UNCC 431) TaxID=512565 RepID=I0HEL6_ACTM4|nr:alanine--tRNA ligase [Actinoplanes missouriensis]BAL91453.1 putative alanyl-tRNA synthetase [Actinoplanes missouriensis 431]
MKTAEVKRRFLAHFEANGHTVVPSAPLPAIDDPNLLFINAGMVQFVPYFLGQQTPAFSRAASVQKCIRTPDIDEVGKTSRHGTFFQMNGNFSFGDYFKAGAIPLAWELSTKPVEQGGFGLDPERIWATVYLDDDEAIEIWKKTGMPAERIVRRGRKDNFWSMGIPGPAGPCSELYYDRGSEYGQEGGPEVDEDRYLEFWNLVFMQHEITDVKSKEDFRIVGDLPKQNIDTGMGLERIASILQGVDNLYEIDEVRPILAKAAEMTGKKYGAHSGHAANQSHPDDVRLRVIADHVRTALMLIGDGVTPSNEGRGYVLRRIMRRAIRAIRLLGWQEEALPILLPIARDCMSPSYPELATDFGRISTYAYAEEDAFLSTLKAGTTILDTAITDTKKSGGKLLAGDKAFQLHDTYGFPIDLTLEIASEQGLSVDEEGFRRLMSDQRARAKADAAARKTGHADLSAYRSALDEGGAVEFTGYQEISRESRVRALIGGSGRVEVAGEGDFVELVLDTTPFYAEGGGQQADTGVINVGGGRLEVVDVQQPVPGLIVHKARVLSGEVRAGETGFAEIDIDRRRAISRSHTATHLVHQTMRNFLGESATQAGSLNAPGRLRFDFNTPGAVSPAVLNDVEQQINEVLLSDLEVHAFITSQEEARRLGAMALFGEKYGDEVRVVEVGDYARELCGGTHVARSGQLGLVKILNESSIGSGVRRVEALVGIDAFGFLAKEHLLVSRLAELFRVPNDQVADRVEHTVAALRDAEKELEKMRAQMVLAGAGGLAEAAKNLDGVAYVGTEAPEGAAGNDVRTLAQEIRGKIDPARPAVVAVTARSGGKASLIVAINSAAKGRGLSASDLVKAALSGRGGGNADLAQGGGVPASEAAKLLGAIEKAIIEAS